MKSEGVENEIADLENIKTVTKACEEISFKGTDNISRRNCLKEVHNVILSSSGTFLQKEEHTILLENIFKSLTLTLSDDSEKCREISATALKDLCLRFCIPESALTVILNTLALRLKKTDEREKSEEVRLIEIDVLYHVIDKYSGDLLKHLNDISGILSNCIVDECPDLKRRSCDCLCLLASKSSHFHMVGGTFLKPLLSIISHQHLKTRALCIKALGCIADYLNHEEFQEATSHLAQRLFDRSPVVRSAVTVVVGGMLLSLKERYSYFHRLIPLLLSALYDDVQEIRSKAQELWIRIGNQYLSENEQDYKDLIDFPRPDPYDYPKGHRPILGCRILVQRHLFNILPALVHDVSDWVPETRLKSSQVLYSLILHSEGKITIKLPTAIEGVLKGAGDENKEVIEQSLKASELLGYFVDPPLLLDSILSLAHGNPTCVHLSILAAVLKGHSGALPPQCFMAVCKFLSDPSVSRFREAKEQANLLLCVDGLLNSGNEMMDSSASYELFTILVSISGLTTNDSVLAKSQDLLKQLADLQSCSEMSLFQRHAISFMTFLTENNELWTYHNPEMPIFHFIVQSSLLDKEMAELIFPVLINNLFPAKEAKLRSKMLSLSVPVFKKLSSSHFEQMSERILDLIRSGIFPNLTWSAGKTACTLRTLASASLFEILNQTKVRKEMLKSLGDELLPTIATLVEDDDATTRLLSCKILEIILPDLVGSIDDLKIHRTCYELLACMDDESEDVRLLATRVLKAYVKSFPDGYDWKLYRSYLKHMFENVLVHLDDKNEKIQLGVFDLLKEVGFAAPDVLLEEIESKKYMMSAGDLCDNLTEHIKKIKL